MKRNKQKCDVCGYEISLSNLSKHANSKACKRNQNKPNRIKILDEWKQESGLYKCPTCDTCFCKNGIGNHIWSKHTDIGIKFRKDTCNENFNNIGRIAWNKGLTQETNEIIKLSAAKRKKKYETGELTYYFLGKKHSEETKRKMSESALKTNHQRICKLTRKYIKKDGTEVLLDSSWEELLAKLLDDKNYKWSRPKPLYWYDSNNKKRRYFPDFYLDDYNIYLDPKNPYVMREQVEKINYLKEHYKNIIILHSVDEINNFEKYLPC